VRLFAAVSLVAAAHIPGTATAAAPVVPPAEQAQMKGVLAQIHASDLGLVPTALPPHFVFDSYSLTATPAGLDVSFADRRLFSNERATRSHEISFDTAYFTGALRRCGAGAKRTLRLGGRVVFVRGSTAWLCARSGRRIVKASATGVATGEALARLVASARPIH
jgi:hypothetical protein